MRFYIDVKVPVIVSCNTLSEWSIIQANGLSPFEGGMEPLLDKLNEGQQVLKELRPLGEARRRGEFQGWNETLGREEYRTSKQSRSREEYEGREEAQPTEETRSREEYRARESEDQTEMPSHHLRGKNRFPDCLLSDSDSEQSQDNWSNQIHNSNDAAEPEVSDDCQLRVGGLPAYLAKDPNRAGPPQMFNRKLNPANCRLGSGFTRRFDKSLEKMVQRHGLRNFASRGGSPNQASRPHRSPAGNSHSAASPTYASENRPREYVQIPIDVGLKMLKDNALKRKHRGTDKEDEGRVFACLR